MIISMNFHKMLIKEKYILYCLKTIYNCQLNFKTTKKALIEKVSSSRNVKRRF